MAALWEDYSKTVNIATLNGQGALELFHNEVDDHVFASAPITIVDGIVTVHTNTDDMFRVKLIVAHELFASADVNALGSHESQNWYRWFCVRGPLVFRLRSKRTIESEHKLWIQWTKVQGSTASDCHVGMAFLMVRHQ